MIRTRSILPFVFAAAAFAQAPAAWTPELSIKFHTLAVTAPSPDGAWLAWTDGAAVMEPEKSETRTHIWLARANGGQRFQLTRGEKSATHPTWSPDSRWIYFVSSREGKADVYRIAVGGGEAERLTKVTGAVTGLAVSPDGRQLAYTTAEPDPEIEKDKKAKTDFRVIDEKPENATLFVIPVEADAQGARPAKALTTKDRHVTEIDWSPDSTRVAFCYWATPTVNDWRKSRLAEVEVATAKIDELTTVEAFAAVPRYSPDGRAIAFIQRSSPKPYPGTARVTIWDRAARQARQLAATPNELPTLLGWSADGKALLVLEAKGTRSVLYTVPLSGQPAALYSPAGVLSGARLNARSTVIGFVQEGSATAPEAFLFAVGPKSPKQLSAANAGIAAPEMGKTEVVRWKAKDGLEIEGLLTLPVGYSAGKRVPLILNIHGGPAGVFSEQFLGRPAIYPLAAFASRGFAILRPNPRGSSGYGHEFRVANLADWGGKDYQDIQAGVDMLIEKGIVDSDRMAVMGWSYGGFMTSWTITQTQRFKAAAIGAGVTNLWSMNGTSDISDFIPDYFGGEAWEKFELYRAHSPLSFAHQVKTPTLILHGEADVRVPISQGYEYYNVLKRCGVPVQMVVYPRTPHSPQESKFMLDLMHRHLDWVAKYIR